MTTREAIVAEARTWLGTRWQHQASVKGAACDCIGFVRGVARNVGFADPFENGEATTFLGYGRRPEPAALLRAVRAFLVPVLLGDALPGDVLLFRFDNTPMHFGILTALDPRYVIHGYAQARKVVENVIDATWQSRMVSAHRYRELA